MEQRTQAEPSVSELSAELVALGVSPEVIVEATQKAVQAHAEREAGERWTAAITGFLVAYKRVSDENVSDSNIEGWFENYSASAKNILEMASKQPNLDEGQRQIARAAAVAHVYNRVETFGFEDDEITELEEYLSLCGIDAQELRDSFKQAYIGLFSEPKNDAQREWKAKLEARFGSFADMHGLWGGDPAMWEATVTPLVGRVYDDVKNSGLELPELNSKGMYDFEAE